MKKIFKLVYNPYTVTTKLMVMKNNERFEPVGESSTMAPIFHQRMQHWLSPNGTWNGFFAELKELSGESQAVIYFVGTADDYADFNAARIKYTNQLDFDVELKKVLTQTQEFEIKGESKLIQINKLIDEASENANPEIMPEEILQPLSQALSSTFEINVVAPVSAGKSTVQNALIGRRLLPTANEAKTAVLTRTSINNGIDKFRAESILTNGERQVYSDAVTQQFVEQLNDEIDPSDPEHKKALRDTVFLEGPSLKFRDSALNLVFVDTPGGNNAMNARHKKMMQKALNDENKNMILFVFSHETIQHEDTKAALFEAAEAMKRNLNGQMSQDRFLFVCTHCDLIPDNLATTEKTIREVLSSCGITNPRLFMVSALIEELLSQSDLNDMLVASGKEEQCEWLDETDETKIENCINYLALPTCDLYKYSVLPAEIQEQIEHRIQELRGACDERKQWLLKVKRRQIQTTLDEKNKVEEELKMFKVELARLNSGMKGLELTIREYLNRYAIPMKIQQAITCVQAKADEIHVRKEATEKWTKSRDAAKKAEKEAEKKLNDYKNSETLKKYHAKVQRLSLDKNAIIQKKSVHDKKLDDIVFPPAYNAKTMTINGKDGKWIPESYASEFINSLNDTIANNMEVMMSDMADYFNEHFVKTCNEIMKDYQDHIQSMQAEGIFDLDGLNIRIIIATKPNFSGGLDLRAMSASTYEKTGTRIVAKSGFWNGVRRFFGSSKGYDEVAVYDYVNYVFVPDIYVTRKAQMKSKFNEWVNEKVSDLEKSIAELKSDVIKRMEELDHYITSIYEEYQKKLRDAKALQDEAIKWKKQSEWIQDFMQKIDHLLDIEPISKQ